MDKALIKQHLNTIDYCMLKLQFELDIIDEKKEEHKSYVYFIKEQISDLDTIRQEYQKELDK